MKNIDSLRDHLFATLEGLRDQKNPMDLDRARAVADVARVIVDSAKVEVEMVRATGVKSGTGFLPHEEAKPGQSRLVKGYAGRD